MGAAEGRLGVAKLGSHSFDRSEVRRSHGRSGSSQCRVRTRESNRAQGSAGLRPCSLKLRAEGRKRCPFERLVTRESPGLWSALGTGQARGGVSLAVLCALCVTVGSLKKQVPTRIRECCTACTSATPCPWALRCFLLYPILHRYSEKLMAVVPRWMQVRSDNVPVQ
jgi:hypothetical protein